MQTNTGRDGDVLGKTGVQTLLLAMSFGILLAAGTERPFAEPIRISESTLKASDQKRLGAVLSFLQAFYASRNEQPAWTDPADVDVVLEIIADARSDGLDPEDFSYSDLREMSHAGHSKEFDIRLTANLVLLGYVLHQGKVDPEFRRIDEFWQRVGSSNAVLDLNIALETGQLREAVDRARPRFSYYDALREALASYRDMAANGGWPSVSAGEVLRLGDTSPRVAEIADRLRATGHLAATPTDPMTFDEALEAAVKAFQAQHGEDADGIVGKRTIAAMNVPVEDRIDQIRVNMERARWIGDLPDRRHVIVNIAGFYAAVMEDEVPTGRPG